MKAKVLWWYGALGIGSIVLIALGISYMESKTEMTDSAGNPIPEGIQKAFDQADTDGNGVLSVREFAQQVQRHRQGVQAQIRQNRINRLRAQFAAGDRDQDGFISKDEYAKLVLVKQLGEKAPEFAAFDDDRDDRLAFGEYAAFREKVASSRPE